MIAAPYYATTELVALAWLRQRTDLDGLVGTTLPKVMPAEGFLTATAIPRAADVDVPQRRAGFVLIDAWAAPPEGSTKPPWGRANRLLERLHHATLDEVQTFGKPITLPTGYPEVRVQAVYIATEAQRIAGDPGGFARYQLDLAVDWVTP